MNIEEEGGGMFDKIKSVGSKIKKATPNPLKLAKKGIGAAKEKAKEAMIARAQAQALKSAQNSLLGAFGSEFGSKKDIKESQTYRTALQQKLNPPTTIPIGKLLIIIAVTGILGAFAALAISKSQNFKDSIVKWSILMVIMIIPIILTYMKKSETLGLLLDTIVQSQINIICIYAIIAFTGYSTLVKTPSLDTFNSMGIGDKIGIIIGLLIPLVIIGYNFFKVSKLDGIVIGVFAVAAAVILLSPPIPGL